MINFNYTLIYVNFIQLMKNWNEMGLSAIAAQTYLGSSLALMSMGKTVNGQTREGDDTMYMNKRRYTPDCNRCDTLCNGKGKNRKTNCTKPTIPKEGFMLAELTLVHATNLNKALSALPFDTNLNLYLK